MDLDFIIISLLQGSVGFVHLMEILTVKRQECNGYQTQPTTKKAKISSTTDAQLLQWFMVNNNNITRKFAAGVPGEEGA